MRVYIMKNKDGKTTTLKEKKGKLGFYPFLCSCFKTLVIVSRN